MLVCFGMVCLTWEMLQLYAQNELISNLMPATGLKIVGTRACLPWCSICSSIQNTEDRLGMEVMIFRSFGGFPAAEEFLVAFDVFFV